MNAWRLCERQFSDRESVLSGEGAKKFGGRWNETGLRLIYAASNASLALLEQLVHMNVARLKSQFVAVEIVIPPDAPGTIVKVEDLPANWRELDNADCIRIGSEWIRNASGLWLSVPSAVNPLERNILINPEHPDLVHCTVSEPAEVIHDPRILERFGTMPKKRDNAEEKLRRRMMGRND